LSEAHGIGYKQRIHHHGGRDEPERLALAEAHIEMIKFIQGDLLKAKTQYIAQGVSTGTQEGLGTGLALEISRKWPEAQKQFKSFTHHNQFQGGAIFVVEPTKQRPGVIYIATQPDMYHATMPFLNRGLRNLARLCAKRQIGSVTLPKIGAGLGKLDWVTQVKPVMMQHLSDGATQFIVCEEFRIGSIDSDAKETG
jgi:O-acetyl-ADP-ribose deacetylase (regulator of RNase III)